MKLTRSEEYVFAYFLSDDALKVTVDPRFYRREEFIPVFEDRLLYATNPLGAGVAGRYPSIAKQFVDLLIEENVLLTSNDKWSGTWHQFDATKYKQVVTALIANTEIISKTNGKGSAYWVDVFERLSREPDAGSSQ